MFNSKYGGVLTFLLLVVIVAIVGVLGYFGYQLFAEKKVEDAAQTAANEFDAKYATADEADSNIVLENLSVDNYTTNTSSKVMLEGYEVIGTIRIPAIDIKYPILDQVTKKSLETAVALLYTESGLNQPGNTVIVGHNYRNSQFFSRNDELEEGDLIYIKDKTGTELKYKITEKFETDASDASFYKSDGSGATKVILSTCTDDASTTDQRVIIVAEAEVEESTEE